MLPIGAEPGLTLRANRRSVLVLEPRQAGKFTPLASTAADLPLNRASPRSRTDRVAKSVAYLVSSMVSD